MRNAGCKGGTGEEREEKREEKRIYYKEKRERVNSKILTIKKNIRKYVTY